MPGPDAMKAASISCVLLLLPSLLLAAPAHFEDTTALAEQDYNYDASESTGCYYNYEHYGEGDRIVTNEPCLNCTCKNRMLMCYLRVCPFTRAIGQDCTVTKSPDQCCPVISCPEVPVQLITSSTTTELPASTTAVGSVDNYGCTMEDNKFYADGAKVPSNPDKPCELCYCIRNRTACVMLECTLQIEGCQPVYEEGVCCPVRYDCDQPALLEGPAPSSSTTTGLVFTTTPSGSLDCYHNGAIYRDGESITTEKPCEHCYCVRGDIVCAVQDCGQPLKGKHCKPNPVPEGQCCPTTFECANSTVPLENLPEVEGTTSLPYETNDLNPPEGTQIDDQPNTENTLDEEIHHNPEDLIVEPDGLPIHDDALEINTSESETPHADSENHPDESTQAGVADSNTSEPEHDIGDNQFPITEGNSETTDQNIGSTGENENKDQTVATNENSEQMNPTTDNGDIQSLVGETIVSSDQSATLDVGESSTSASANQEASTDAFNDRLPNADNNGELYSNNAQSEDGNVATTSSVDTSNNANDSSSLTIEQSENLTPSTENEYHTTASADLGVTESSLTNVNEDGSSTVNENNAGSSVEQSETESGSQEESFPTSGQDSSAEPSSAPGIIDTIEDVSLASGHDDVASSVDVTATESSVNKVHEEVSSTAGQYDAISSDDVTATESSVNNANEEVYSTASQDGAISSSDVTATESSPNNINEGLSSTSDQNDVISNADVTATETSVNNVNEEVHSTLSQDDAISTSDVTATDSSLNNINEEPSSISDQNDAISNSDVTATETSVNNINGEVSSTLSQDGAIPSSDVTATDSSANNINEGLSSTSGQHDISSTSDVTTTDSSANNINEGLSSTSGQHDTTLSSDVTATDSSANNINEGLSSTSGQADTASSFDITATDSSANNINEGLSSTSGQTDTASSSDLTATESSANNINEGLSSTSGQNDAVSNADVTTTGQSINNANGVTSSISDQGDTVPFATESTVQEESLHTSDQPNDISSAEPSSTEPSTNIIDEASFSTSVENDEISSAEPASTEPAVSANVNDEINIASEHDGVVNSEDKTPTESTINNIIEEGSSTFDQHNLVSIVESATESENNNENVEIAPTSSINDAVPNFETTENSIVDDSNIVHNEQDTVSNNDNEESSTAAIVNSNDVSNSANQDAVTSNENSVTLNSNDNVEITTIVADLASSDIKEPTSVTNEPSETSTSVETSSGDNLSSNINEDASSSNVAQTESLSDAEIDSASGASLDTTQNVNTNTLIENNEVLTNVPVINFDKSVASSAEITPESDSLVTETSTGSVNSGVNDEVPSENQDNIVNNSDADHNESSTASEKDSSANQDATSQANIIQTQDSTEQAVSGVSANSEVSVGQDEINVTPGLTSEAESSTSAIIEENSESFNQDGVSPQTEGSTESIENVSSDIVTTNNDILPVSSTELTVDDDQSSVGVTENQNIADLNVIPTGITAQDISPTEKPELDSESPIKDDTSSATTYVQSNDVQTDNKLDEADSSDAEPITTVRTPSGLESISSNELKDKIGESVDVSSTTPTVNEVTSDQTQDKLDHASSNSNELSGDAISPTTPEQSQTDTQTNESQPSVNDDVSVESDPNEDLIITPEEHDVLETEVHVNTNVLTDVNNVSPASGDCIIDEQVHANNSRIETRNPCHIQCLCINGAPSCESIECPPPPPTHKNCMPIHPGPDLCCPAYACDGPLTPALQSDSQVSMDYEKPSDESTSTEVFTVLSSTEASATFDKLTETTSDVDNEVTSDGSNSDSNQAAISSSTVENDASSSPDQAVEYESSTQSITQQSSTIGDLPVPYQEIEKNGGTEASTIPESSHSTTHELNADLISHDEIPVASTEASDTTNNDQSAESPSTTVVNDAILGNDQVVTEQTAGILENSLSSTSEIEKDQTVYVEQEYTSEQPNKDEENTEKESLAPVTENIQANGDQQTAYVQEVVSPSQTNDQSEGTLPVEGQSITEQDGLTIETSTSASQESSVVSQSTVDGSEAQSVESEPSTDGIQEVVTNNDEQQSDNLITTSAPIQGSSSENQDEITNSDSIQQVSQEQTTSSSFVDNQESIPSITSNSEPVTNTVQNGDNELVQLEDHSTSDINEESSTQAIKNQPANVYDQSAMVYHIESTAIPSMYQETATEVHISDANTQDQSVSVSQENAVESATLSNSLTSEEQLNLDQSEHVNESVHENDILSENGVTSNQNEQETLNLSEVTANGDTVTSSPVESDSVTNNESDVITETVTASSSDTENSVVSDDSLVNEGQSGVSDSTTSLPVSSESIGEQDLIHTQSEGTESASATVSINSPSEGISNVPSDIVTELPISDDKMTEETDISSASATFENDNQQTPNDATTVLPIQPDNLAGTEQHVTQSDIESPTSSSIQAEPAQEEAVLDHSEPSENQEQLTSLDSDNIQNNQIDSENQQPIESITETLSTNEFLPTENESDNSVSDIESPTAGTFNSESTANEQQTVGPSKDQQNIETESVTDAITSQTGSDESQPTMNQSLSPQDSVVPTSTGSNDQLTENDSSTPLIGQSESITQGDQTYGDESLISEGTNAPVSQDTEQVNNSELRPGTTESSLVENDNSVSQGADTETSTAITSESEPQVEGDQQNVEHEQSTEEVEHHVSQDIHEGSAETSTGAINQSDLPNEPSVSTEELEKPVSQDSDQVSSNEVTTPSVELSSNEQPANHDGEPVGETVTSAPVTSHTEEQHIGDPAGSTLDVQESLPQNADQGVSESTTTLPSQSDSNAEEPNVDQTQSIVQPIIQEVNQDTESTTSVSSQSEPESSQAQNLGDAESETIQSEPQVEGEEPNVHQQQPTEDADQLINQEGSSQDTEHVSGTEAAVEYVESELTTQGSLSESQAEGDQTIVDVPHVPVDDSVSQIEEDKPIVDETQSSGEPASQDAESGVTPTIGEPSSSLPVTEQPASQDTEVVNETESPYLQTSQQETSGEEHSNVEQSESTELPFSQDISSESTTPGFSQSAPIDNEQPIIQDTESSTTGISQSEPESHFAEVGEPISHNADQTGEFDSTTPLPTYNEPSNEAAPTDPLVTEVQGESESTTITGYSEPTQNQDTPNVGVTSRPSIGESEQPQNIDQSDETVISPTVQPQLIPEEQAGAISQNADEAGNIETSTSYTVAQPTVQDISESSSQNLDQHDNEGAAPADENIHKDKLGSDQTNPPISEPNGVSDGSSALPDRVGQPQEVETSSPENIVPELHSVVPETEIEHSEVSEQDAQQAQNTVPAVSNYSSPVDVTSPHFNDIVTTSSPIIHQTLGFPMAEGIDPQLSEFLSQMSTQTPWTHKPNIEDPFPLPETDYDDEEEDSFGPGTCRYGGKVYVSAQQIPRDDPCDFCFCFRSDIICLQQSCPPPIHGCRQETIQGFCCPRYECHVSMGTGLNLTTTTTTTTTTLPPHFLPHVYNGAARHMGCFLEGRAYIVGEKVQSRSGPCLDCICGDDGKMKCEPQKCTPEPLIRKMMESTSR